MNALEAYLARDRCQAIAHNETLSDRAKGAVLFADISGFTPLTEAFTQTLGARRGAEELTGQLNRVYEALIAEIENYDGSVIAFAGDAALCWFVEQAPDHPQSAWRAVTCAFALQNSMRRFANIPLPDGTNIALGIKVAVTSGTVRRFVVGDPLIRCIDVLAGDPVARSAEGERLSDRTEILLDEATVNALAQDLELLEWRTAKTGERFAAARALRKNFPSQPPPSCRR